MGVNLQTWVRLQRLELESLSNAVGNAALTTINAWPQTGEGRAVKEASERIHRLLQRVHATREVQGSIAVIEQAGEELRRVLSNSFFQDRLYLRNFTNRTGKRAVLGQSIEVALISMDEFLLVHRPPAIAQGTSPTATMTVAAPLRAIESILPAQQEGPLKFEFRAGVLHVAHQTNAAHVSDHSNMEAARAALTDAGSRLIPALETSNADPRLTGVVADMQRLIDAQEDAVQLGIASITCQRVSRRFEHELAEVVSGRLEAYNVAVGLYVAQFPSWQRFVAKAGESDQLPNDSQIAKVAARDLVKKLRETPTLVDPEVPRSLQLLIEAVDSPGIAGKRATFALLRSLENIIARIFGDLGGILAAVPEGIQAGVKRGITGTVALAVVAGSLAAATKIAPSAERVLQAYWIRDGVKIIEDALASSS